MSTKDNRRPGPDQAAGWIIAMACFFINFICAGLARTAGVLYVALIELYGVSREAATTPFSIRVCVRNMTGPLIGLLGLRYGIRAVTTCGGAVAALGSILCYFAPNVTWITVFWGAIHGFGFGLSTVLHMMMIGLYFDKYKASALGLGYSGDCFGTFAFPVIMEHLLGTYDVQGTFLILGGIVLHVIPLALILRKPPWMKASNRRKGTSIASQKVLNGTKEGDNRNSMCYKNEAFVNSKEDSSTLESSLADGKKSNNAGLENDDPPVYQEAVLTDRRVNCLRYELSSMTGSLRSYGNRSEISEFIRENMDRHDSLPPVLEKETAEGDNPLSESFSISGDIPQSPTDGSNAETASRCIKHSESTKKKRSPSFMEQMAHEIVHKMRTASFASQVAQDGFICNLQQDQQHEEPKVEDHLQQDLYIPKDPENGPSVGENTKASSKDIFPPEIDVNINLSGSLQHCKESGKSTSVFKTLMHTNSKPIFVLISMTMAVFAFLFVGVLTIIIDYATDHGVSQDKGKYLIIGFSVTDLIGRLSFGQVIDRKLVKMKNYAGVTTLLMGILVGAIPLNTSYNYMLVCMCMYGLVQGGAAIMFPILVSCYMEKNEESVAMGCLNFYGGLLMLGLAPMIGYFRDSTGSYNGVFYILGGLNALVGIVWQFEPLIVKFQNRRLHKRHANYVPQTKF